MERAPEDGKESPRIDVRTLPESLARLWEDHAEVGSFLGFVFLAG